METIQTPAFLVDIEKVKRNCDEMRQRCEKLGVCLRANLKTHKTIEGAVLMTAGTKRCVTVSTLKEAEFFADAGFDDMLYGSPLNHTHVSRCKKLSERLEKFHVLVDSFHAVEILAKTRLNDNKRWSVMLKIDVGTNRAGVAWSSNEAVELAKRLSENKNIHFEGLYAYCGGLTYISQSPEEISSSSNLAAERLLELKERLFGIGITFKTWGIGSTPAASYPGNKLGELTELHPGSYIFYDVEQTLIGATTLDHVACKVATRVTGHYPEKGTMLVDCGFLALSHDGKDKVPPGGYCIIEGHPELKLTMIDQEVGMVMPVSGEIDYQQFPLGSMLFFYPFHSSVTAAMHPFYYIHDGDKIVDKWTPMRGW